ncbi:MAG TPA: hypothetical protein VIK01_23515 [Polyangiaceae bacterium]
MTGPSAARHSCGWLSSFLATLFWIASSKACVEMTTAALGGSY